MPEYPKEQMWKIYEQLPDELKDAIFSEETSETVHNICEKNGIEEYDKISEVARLTGHVLLGLIPPNEFQENLEQQLKIKEGIAKKINFEIYRFVFYPVKESLASLYQTEITPTKRMIQEKSVKKSEQKKSTKKDVYRESVE